MLMGYTAAGGELTDATGWLWWESLLLGGILISWRSHGCTVSNMLKLVSNVNHCGSNGEESTECSKCDGRFSFDSLAAWPLVDEINNNRHTGIASICLALVVVDQCLAAVGRDHRMIKFSTPRKVLVILLRRVLAIVTTCAWVAESVILGTIVQYFARQLIRTFVVCN